MVMKSIIITQSLFIVLALILISCGERTDQINDLSFDSERAFVSYKIDLNGKEAKLAELVEHIEVIRLEDTEESLLGGIGHLNKYEGQYVFRSGKDGDIYFFSENGQYLRKINRFGSGPEEYEYVNDFWINKDMLNLYVRNQAIKRYDMQGNYISSTKVPFQASHVLPYEEGYLLDMNYRFLNDSINCAFVYMSEEMELIASFIENKRDPGFWISTDKNTIQKNSQDALLFRVMDDTVYRVNEGMLEPAIHYDFGENWYWRDKSEVDDSMFELKEDSDQIWFIEQDLGNDFSFLTVYRGASTKEFFLVDRESRESVHINMSIGLNESLPVRTNFWSKDVFIMNLTSDVIGDFLATLSVDQWSFTQGTTLDIIESSENPVLLKIKFKDSSEW